MMERGLPPNKPPGFETGTPKTKGDLCYFKMTTALFVRFYWSFVILKLSKNITHFLMNIFVSPNCFSTIEKTSNDFLG